MAAAAAAKSVAAHAAASFAVNSFAAEAAAAAAATAEVVNADQQESGKNRGRRTYPFNFKVEIVRRYLREFDSTQSSNRKFVRAENDKATSEDQKFARSAFSEWLKDVDIMVAACQEDLDVSTLERRPKPPKEPQLKEKVVKVNGTFPRKTYKFGTKVRYVRQYLKERNEKRGVTRKAFLDRQEERVELSTFRNWLRDATVLEGLEQDDDKILDYTRKSPKFTNLQFAAVEAPLKEWIIRTNLNASPDDKPLTLREVRRKALQISADVLPDEKCAIFAASDGWVHRFLQNNNIVDHTIHGKTVISDKTALTSLSSLYYYFEEKGDDCEEMKEATRKYRGELQTLIQKHRTVGRQKDDELASSSDEE